MVGSKVIMNKRTKFAVADMLVRSGELPKNEGVAQ